MTDQEAQEAYDEAWRLTEQIAESNDAGLTMAKSVALVPRLWALTHYLLQEMKSLKAEVERLKTPRRTQSGGRY